MPIPKAEQNRGCKPAAFSKVRPLARILSLIALITIGSVGQLGAQSVGAQSVAVQSAAPSDSGSVVPASAEESLVGQDQSDDRRVSGDIECAIRLQLILEQPLLIKGVLGSQQASFTKLRNLSMEAGTTGAFFVREPSSQAQNLQGLVQDIAKQPAKPEKAGIDQAFSNVGQELCVQPRQQIDRLGVEFHYRGPRAEVLKLNLRFSPKPRSEETNVNIEIPIEDVLRGVIDQKLTSGIRLWVGRPGGDALRVSIGAGRSMVFTAGEQVPLGVDILAAPGLIAQNPSDLSAPSFRSMELKMELTNDRTGATAWQKSVPIDSAHHAGIYSGVRTELFADKLDLPTEEGVYTLRTRIVPSGSWRVVERLSRPEFLTRPNLLIRPDMLLAEESIVERATQFVVLGSSPPPVEPTELKEIAHWTPSQRSWLGFESNSLNSTQPVELVEHEGMTVAKLAPETQISQSIKIAGKGMPHILVVKYFRDQPVKMTVAVRQKDKAGKWSAIGMDTGVVDDWSLDHFPETHASKLAEHRVVFWPGDEQPLLILRNENNRADLKIESISVLAGPSSLASAVGESQPLTSAMDSTKRLAAVYLDKPLMADSFGCERQLDASGQVALDDWTTFLQAGTRLVDYVRASGANAAVIGAVSEGGSLFPTEILSATPRYDTGVFFGDGRDPIQKDIVELFYRLFQRAGIKLVLSVELATPMPQLEKTILATGKGTGLVWVDHLGRELLEQQPARRGIGAYYNILNPQVESQLQLLIDDIVQRYSHHESFGGIGLQLGSNSILQLPGPSFGRDVESLTRFRTEIEEEVRRNVGERNTAINPTAPRTTTLEIPNTVPALNAWLDAEGKESWVRWRARQLSSVFQRASSRLKGFPLVLITADYRPANADLPGGDALQFGLDWQELASTPNVTPLRLIRRRQLVEPARRIEDARLNEDMVLNEMLRYGLQSRFNPPHNNQASHLIRQQSISEATSVSSGGLLFSPPEPLEITVKNSANSVIPLTLFPQAVSAVPQHVRDVAQFIDTMDSQMILVGGWAPAIAPRTEMRNWYKAFGSLPSKPFQDVEPSDAKSAVVRMRQCVSDNSLWIYAVNCANWSMVTSIYTDAPAGTVVRQYAGETSSWQIGVNLLQDSNEQAAMATQSNSIVDGLSQCWNGILQPGELVVLEVVGPTRGIGRWTARSVVDPIPEIASRLDDLTARVSILGQPREHFGLVNGSFEDVLPREKDGPASLQLDGWMRSQHPANCVELTRDAAHGQVAVQLRTDDTPGARTWLLSTPLTAPETGRLAVSLRAKALAGNPILRIAVEGRVRGAALRYSVNVQPKPIDTEKSEVANPTLGKQPTTWPEQAYWLYVTDLPDAMIEDLRIAVDLVTPGQVAVDEVRFFDFFFTQQERDVLQRQTFVAVERLTKGDLTSAMRLLDSHWAKYLRWLEMPQLASSPNVMMGRPAPGTVPPEPTARPHVANNVTNSASQSWRSDNAPSVPSSTSTPVSPATTPQSFAERIRQYLPAPFRF